MDIDSEKKQNEKIVLTIGMILILVVALVTFFRPAAQKKSVPEEKTDVQDVLPTISAKSLQEKISQEAVMHIIDIREPNDFLQEHLPFATNIPFGNLPESDINFPKDESLVIVGYLSDQSDASAQAVEILKKKGFSDINILLGGLEFWKSVQGKTISLGNPALLIDQSKVIFISTDDLKNIFDNNLADSVYILDIRPQSAFTKSHIPKAINIPLFEIEQRKKEIPERKMIIIYGENQAQGFQAGVLLYDLDFITAKVVQGGFAEWKEKNFSIVSQ